MTTSVLLLGANSDIAKAMAHEYAAQGHNLILAARQPQRLEKLANDLHIRHQVEVQCVEFDAIAFDSHPDFLRQFDPIPEIAVVVFGYLGNQTTAQQDFAEAKRVIDTNYTGAVSIMELLAAAYEKQGHGTLVGISSVAGDRGRQSNYIYGSAKAGFSAYLSGLRNRLFHQGVHVLTVKPGFVATAMVAGLDLPPLLTATPQAVAKDIVKAQQKGRNVLYTRWYWCWILLIVRNVPEFLFKKLKM